MTPAARAPLYFFRRFILLVMIALLAACSKKPQLAPLPSGSVVLAVGDSVTYGTGAAKGEDWPALLASLTGWQIINEGIPGDTAEAGKGRLKSLLDAHRPALVIIEIGGNDFLKRRAHKAVKEDIRQILTTVRQSGAKAVLVAVPELSLLSAVGRPSDAAFYAELGKEEKVPVIENVFSDVLAHPELRADAIHPNSKGYRQMAEEVLRNLKALGLVKG